MPRIEERHRGDRQTTGKALLAADGALAAIALCLLLRPRKPCPPCGPPLLAFGGSDGTLGPNVTVATSNDGITWTRRPTPLDGGPARLDGSGGGWVYDAVYAPELAQWVAVGSDQGLPNKRTTMVSADGITWTLVASPFDGPLNGPYIDDLIWAAELGMFVAVGFTAGGGQMATSNDGVHWNDYGLLPIEGIAQCVAWAPELGLLVVGGNLSGGNINPALLITSSDGGAHWTQRPSPFDDLFATGQSGGGLVLGVAWSAALHLFVAVGADGRSGVTTTICTSPDGIVWTHRPSPWDGGPLPANFQDGYGVDVLWADWLGRFVAVGGSQFAQSPRPNILTSPDGVVWTPETVDFNNNRGATGIGGEPATGLFATGFNFDPVTGGSAPVIASSPDGFTWTPRPSPFDPLGYAIGVAAR